MARLADQNYAAQINSNKNISIMIHFMEENIKSTLQLKYIFNTIRFKLYSGGCMKGFYSKKKKKKQQQQQQQQWQRRQRKIIANNLNNHSYIKQF